MDNLRYFIITTPYLDSFFFFLLVVGFTPVFVGRKFKHFVLTAVLFTMLLYAGPVLFSWGGIWCYLGVFCYYASFISPLLVRLGIVIWNAVSDAFAPPALANFLSDHKGKWEFVDNGLKRVVEIKLDSDAGGTSTEFAPQKEERTQNIATNMIRLCTEAIPLKALGLDVPLYSRQKGNTLRLFLEPENESPALKLMLKDDPKLDVCQLTMKLDLEVLETKKKQKRSAAQDGIHLSLDSTRWKLTKKKRTDVSKEVFSPDQITDGSMLEDWFFNTKKATPEIFVHTPEKSWLEYKASLFPRDEKNGENDQKYAVECKRLRWHIARGIVSIANSGGGLVVIGVVEDKENNKNKPQEELSPQYEYKKGDEDEFLRRLKEKLLTPAGEWAVPPPPKDKNSQHNGKDTAEKAAPCFFAIYDEDRAEYGILRSRVHISLFKKADKTATGCIAVFIPSVQHPIRVLDIKQKGLSHTTLLLQRCETAGEVSAMAGDSIRKIMKDFTPEPYEESFRQLAFKLNTLL